MSDLVKYQKSRIELAKQGVKISETDHSRDGVKKVYLKTLFIAGQKNWNEADVRMQIDLLDNLLRQNYGSITIEELAFASEQGVIGKYGEFHGINPATFCKWINAYFKSLKEDRHSASHIPIG